MFMPNSVMRFVACVSAAGAVAACSKSDNAKVDTAAPQPAAAASPSSTTASTDSMVLVRGSVTSLTANQVVVKTDSASVTVAITPPLQVYSRGPGDLAHVAQNAFIGVTTEKQPDGAEKATEIHIFPDQLRGLGEGSRMMTAPANGSAASRMTNGSVSTAATPSSSAGGSRMTNGSVASASSANGSTMVVQYAGGSTTVTVPPNVPVTEIKPATHTLAVGDAVVIVATKGSDGSLTSNKALLAK
jgi:hypothetical protein